MKRIYIVFASLIVIAVAGTGWAEAGRNYATGAGFGLGTAFVLWIGWIVLRWIITGFFPALGRKSSAQS